LDSLHYGSIGYGRVELKSFNETTYAPATGVLQTNTALDGDTANNFAWNIGVGVDYAVTNNIVFGLGYMFTDAGKARTGSAAFFDDVANGGLNSAALTLPAFQADHTWTSDVVATISYVFDSPNA